jgi:hypothetical protein
LLLPEVRPQLTCQESTKLQQSFETAWQNPFNLSGSPIQKSTQLYHDYISNDEEEICFQGYLHAASMLR